MLSTKARFEDINRLKGKEKKNTMQKVTIRQLEYLNQYQTKQTLRGKKKVLQTKKDIMIKWPIHLRDLTIRNLYTLNKIAPKTLKQKQQN